MLKTLFIATSALALTAGVAAAQEANVTGVTGRPTATTPGTMRAAFGEQDTFANAATTPSARQGNKAGAASFSTSADTIIDNLTGTGMADAAEQANGNTGLIDQDGSRNDAAITQNGSQGYAVVKQGSANNGTLVNEADVTQGTGENRAFIQQLATGGNAPGNPIQATIEQANAGLGLANNAAIIQGGSRREGTASGVSTIFNAIANVNQSGANNDAVIAQGTTDNANGQDNTGGNAGNFRAGVLQNGNNNAATVQQEVNARVVGFDGKEGITQNGNNNRANILQMDGGTAAGSLQQAELHQRGNGNFGVIDQVGNDVASQNFQFGGNNTLWVEQSGDNGYSGVTQDGFGNYAEVRQDSANSSSTIYQGLDAALGDNNQAYVTQTADFAESRIASHGDNNLAVVFQGVANDFANISQTGNTNIASIRQ